MPKGIAVYAVLPPGSLHRGFVEQFRIAGFPGNAVSSMVLEERPNPSQSNTRAVGLLASLGLEPILAAKAGDDLRSGGIFVVVMCRGLDAAAKAAELLENSGARDIGAAQTRRG